MKGDINKLVSDGLYKQALSLYTNFHKTNSYPHNFFYSPLFKACAKLKASPQGLSLHAIAKKTGSDRDVYTATAITDMYMKLQRLIDAHKMFDEIPERNIASVNAIISGLSQNGYCREALVVARNVHLDGLRPNSVTVASVLSGCENAEHGLQIHGLAVKLGVEMDVYVGTALLSMYSNCGEVVSALKVFISIPDKNIVCYNALLTVLLHNGKARRVLDMFKAMRQSLRERSSVVTWVSVLSACSVVADIRFGMQVHCLILQYELEYDVMVGTTLIDMYCKCRSWEFACNIFNKMGCNRNLFTWNSLIAGLFLNGQCESAVKLFEKLECEGLVPDSTSWNSMISGFAQGDKADEAFCFFHKMQLAGETPSLKSVTSLLPACSTLSDSRSGKVIHGHTIRTSIQDDEFITTSLIDMYMKCGYPSWARQVFDRFDQISDDSAIWNAMISGYGRNGENENALEVFELMEKHGVRPNAATFTGILSACSHAGKVEQGLELFKTVTRDYGLNPTPEHFGCIVDLLGRVGRLDDALDLIQHVSDPIASFYSSLLGACRCHSDAELGEEIAERLSQLDPRDPTPLVILSNIYAEQGRWNDVNRVRQMMTDRGLRKIPGCSLIGTRKELHTQSMSSYDYSIATSLEESR